MAADVRQGQRLAVGRATTRTSHGETDDPSSAARGDLHVTRAQFVRDREHRETFKRAHDTTSDRSAYAWATLVTALSKVVELR